MSYEIKDSGTRTEFAGGMVRDADAGNKTDYTSVMFGPMLERWAVHCTKGRVKYPDSEPGIPNWTLASSIEEWLHARGSLLRHLMAFLRGEQDEDHAAAIMFNVNLMEYTRERIGYTPDVFITAPVSEDNAGPEEEGGEKRVTERALSTMRWQAIDAAVAARDVGVATPVDARPVQLGYDALYEGDEMLSFVWDNWGETEVGLMCEDASPTRLGHTWACERPKGHDGDHAWNPLRNEWTREWAEDKVTRWAQRHLTVVPPPEEELPDE